MKVFVIQTILIFFLLIDDIIPVEYTYLIKVHLYLRISRLFLISSYMSISLSFSFSVLNLVLILSFKVDL